MSIDRSSSSLCCCLFFSLALLLFVLGLFIRSLVVSGLAWFGLSSSISHLSSLSLPHTLTTSAPLVVLHHSLSYSCTNALTPPLMRHAPPHVLSCPVLFRQIDSPCNGHPTYIHTYRDTFVTVLQSSSPVCLCHLSSTLSSSSDLTFAHTYSASTSTYLVSSLPPAGYIKVSSLSSRAFITPVFFFFLVSSVESWGVGR